MGVAEMTGLLAIGGSAALVALVFVFGVIFSRRSRVHHDPRTPEMNRAQAEIAAQIARGRSGVL